MLTNNLQQLLDQCTPGESISLPAGEYQGPFVIRKPCTLTGSAATLWAERGPVLIVEASGVKLHDLWIDVTGHDTSPGSQIAVLSRTGDTTAERVSVHGDVMGFPGEAQVSLPPLLTLGEFYADRTNTFYMDITVGNATRIVSEIRDLRISPEEIPAGTTRVTLATGILSNGTYLYWPIQFCTNFIRRVYVSGTAVGSPAGYTDGRVVFTAPEAGGVAAPIAPSVIPAPASTPIPTIPPSIPVLPPHTPASITTPDRIPPPSPMGDPGSAQQGGTPTTVLPSLAAPMPLTGGTELLRGQRIALGLYADQQLKFRLQCENRPAAMDIDGFLFALQENGKVKSDADLIFFNQPNDAAGSLQYLGGQDAAVSVKLPAVRQDVARIAIAYAIYGNRAAETFGILRNLMLLVLANGTLAYRFPITELTTEKTLVGLELYRYQGSWKCSAVGAGYRGGMSALCRSYGVEVNE